MPPLTTTGRQCLKPVQYHNLVLNVPCHLRYLATDTDGDTYGFVGNRPMWNPVKGSWYSPRCTPQFIDTNNMIPDCPANCSCVSINSETSGNIIHREPE